jgi:hypothetical protein
MRARWYPETHQAPGGRRLTGLTERERDGRGRRAGWSPTRAATRPLRLLAIAPLLDAGLLVRRRRHHRPTRSRASPSRARRVGADALLRGARQPLGLRRVQPPATAPRSSRGPGARGHLHAAPHPDRPRDPVDDLPARRPGTTEEALAASTSAPTRRDLRPPGRRVAAEIKHVAHTNFCDIGWRVDPSGRVILVSVIDNLVKGASGQAVQNLNVMLGIDERTGCCDSTTATHASGDVWVIHTSTETTQGHRANRPRRVSSPFVFLVPFVSSTR